jgi:hypothetical protein
MYNYDRTASSDEQKASDLVKLVREAEQHRRKAEMSLIKAKLVVKSLDPVLVKEYNKTVDHLSKASKMIDDLYRKAVEIRG